jgi:3-dehydrosphinganine reductase
MNQWRHSIISGGGSGLGLGLAQRLLRRGGHVSILDLAVRDEARRLLDQAAAGSSASWQFFAIDIVDEAGVHAAVDAAVRAHGAPQLAINSAGIALNRVFAEMRGEEFRRVIDINLNGACHFSAAVLPHLRAGSRLALIASMAGLVGNYGYSAYGASKFGVVGLATALRYEYEPRGIGITCVCPPEVKTPLVSAERSPGNANPISLALKDLAGSLEPEYACDDILRGIDRGRWMVISGSRARLTASLARHVPGLFSGAVKLLIGRLLRKHGGPSSDQARETN